MAMETDFSVPVGLLCDCSLSSVLELFCYRRVFFCFEVI